MNFKADHVVGIDRDENPTQGGFNLAFAFTADLNSDIYHPSSMYHDLHAMDGACPRYMCGVWP